MWPNGPSSVRVHERTVTLTPTTRRGELSVTINIDGGLADYYFGHWGYTHKLLESPSYLVEVYLTNLSYPVSDVITLTEKKGDWGNTIADLGGGFAGGALATFVVTGSNPLTLTGLVTFGLGTVTTEYIVKPTGEFIWDIIGRLAWGITTPGANESDENSIAGG